MQAWVRELLVQSLDRLKQAEGAKGNAELFARLRVYLEGDGSGKSYAELAAEIQMSEGAIKVAVHRLRRRFRETLLDELGHTVEDTAEAEEELRYLFEISRG